MKHAHAPSTSPATLYKTQNTFIRYLDIYLATSVEQFPFAIVFLPTVEKYQRGEKILFVKKTHVEVWDIHTKILAAGFNKTIAAFWIYHCDTNGTSDSN